MSEGLNDRSQAILEAIIEDYIESAEPVGSRAITRRHPVGLSPASVRNVMSDLEDLGYLQSPHTSAGRVPTEKGFRFYIDSLLQVRKLSNREQQQLEHQFQFDGLHAEDLVREAGKALSSISHYTGVVLAPRFETSVFKQIEFLPLSGGRILVILVADSGLVQNRVIELDESLSQRELEQAANYLNNRLAGLPIQQVREELLSEMAQEKALYDEMLQKALLLSKTVLQDEAKDHIFIEGASNLLEHPDFVDVEKMKQIFRTFEAKGRLVKLLDQSQQADGVQIFIGSESSCSEISGCSLITAPYTDQKGIIGTLGVIGPMRMDYSSVIPVVDYTAKVVSRILELEDH